MAPLIVMAVAWIVVRTIGFASLWEPADSVTGALRPALAAMFLFTAGSHFHPRTRGDLIKMVPTSLPSPSFLVVDPRRVLPDYRARLNQSDLTRLGGTDETSLVWLAIVTVADDGLFANLRAPVVINPARMLGFQLVPSDSVYPLRQPLFAE